MRFLQRIPRHVVVLLLLLVIWPAIAVASPPKVNGRIETIGPFRVVRVWGSPEEMGFAHGYLAGADFLVYLEERIASIPPEHREAFDAGQNSLRGAIRIPKRAKVEIAAIFEGIKQAHGLVPHIEGLNRQLTLDDLILHNAGDALRAFACSGFTVWGDKAGGAGVVTTRNFDYPVPGPKSLQGQMILVREPTGRHRVATITWGGYIGAFTGINDAGVCGFMHDGTGLMIRRPQGKYTPLALVIAEALEDASVSDAQSLMHDRLAGIMPYPFSYFIRLITPRRVDGQGAPVRVFRVDATGISENPIGRAWSVTTNHYLEKDFSPAAGAGADSLNRFTALSNRIASVVTPESAWTSLRAVAATGPTFTTLHSLVVYPEKRKLDLAFATYNKGRIVPATRGKPTTITFDQLFSDHE